jgi:hypothetical protein
MSPSNLLLLRNNKLQAKLSPGFTVLNVCGSCDPTASIEKGFKLENDIKILLSLTE